VIADPYWNDYLLNDLLINVALLFVGGFLWLRYRRRQR